MFENFKRLIIKGGCFENEAELELFKKDKLTVVYGRNGSGKTTIAHCIAELTKPDEEKSADYTVKADAPIADDMKESVLIFDEDFVRDQVRVEGEGINTIVMLGEQVELDEKISKEKENFGKVDKEWNDLKALQDQYEDAEMSFSPGYYFNKIRDGLREEGGWADIDRDLKGNTLKSRVTGDVIENLLNIAEPKATYEELREMLMADLNLYLESENAEVIDWKIEERHLPGDLQELKDLLEKKVDAPRLTEREQRLINIIAEHPQHSTQETKQLVAEGWEYCPLCLREITVEDAERIKNTLTRILNEEAEKYGKLLDVEIDRFREVSQLLPVFPGELHKDEINAAQVVQENLNRVLDLVRRKIEERKRRIYDEMPWAITEEMLDMYRECITEWRKAMTKLEKQVKSFNSTVSERRKLYDRIRNSNNILARKQLNALLLGYKQAVANSDSNKKYLENKRKEREDSEQKIKQLVQQKERTDIALDYINKELRYVFYSNRKVKLEPGEGCYKLKVNGRNVRPNKISVGERNVLGLCYFFAKLYSGKTEAGRYASESLIVIDDPVSSFDYGNRVGVMSLLRFQFGNILKGNDKSRILVMSHDLHSVFDLVKIRNEVVAGRKPDQAFMELHNNKLEVKYMQNEYKKLLEYVYAYAANTGADDPDETQEMSIGNVMRRMMEAFSSFCYNDTFERMVRNPEVLAIIPDGKRGYYENFMGRLTLNTESHMAESVYTLDTITTCFTKDEKLQTAKSVLLFLLYVNRPHLVAYLDAAQLATIENWKTEEAGWLVE